MVIDALTPEEIARHERALEKIRRKLFARHTPDDFGIAPGSEEILSATAEQRWCAGIGNYRRITWGGLQFTIAANESRFVLTISHFERDVFTFHIANEKGHTEVVSSVRFAVLDSSAWRYVRNLYRDSPRTKRP